MTVNEIKNSFNQTLDTWEKATEAYKDGSFRLRSSENEWTLGQLYEHLTGSTKRMLLMIDKCLSGNSNQSERKTDMGEYAFQTNTLTNGKIQNPAHKENPPSQPEDCIRIKADLKEIREKFRLAAEKISESKATGRERHPALGFLNAQEWLQSIDMHWRHHLKQKQGIETFLAEEPRE